LAFCSAAVIAAEKPPEPGAYHGTDQLGLCVQIGASVLIAERQREGGRR